MLLPFKKRKIKKWFWLTFGRRSYHIRPRHDLFSSALRPAYVRQAACFASCNLVHQCLPWSSADRRMLRSVLPSLRPCSSNSKPYQTKPKANRRSSGARGAGTTLPAHAIGRPGATVMSRCHACRSARWRRRRGRFAHGMETCAGRTPQPTESLKLAHSQSLACC